jgi:regulator of protease activity HflC (stomatin/prohibitin superfamily)
MEELKMNKLLVAAGLALVGFIALLILFPVFTVGAGEVGVTFNRFSGETQSYSQGTHFRVPLVHAVYKFDVKTQRVDMEAESASKDLQIVHVTAMLNYHLTYSKVNELFVKVGRDYIEKIIHPATNEVIKAAVAKFPVEQIIVNRETLKELIQKELAEKLLVYNIELESVNLVNINFDPEFNKVVEQKQIEEQKIKLAEYQKRQAIEYKEKTILEAQAEAEKQRLMKSNVNEQIIALEWIKKWSGNLPETMMGDKGILMINPKTGQ